MEVLAEKLRGLSKGLLPAVRRGRTGFTEHLAFPQPPLSPLGKAIACPGSATVPYWGDPGRCSAWPQHSPHLWALRVGREGARGLEMESPPPGSSCCCFGSWRRKRKSDSFGEVEDGQGWEAWTWAALLQLVRLAARGHGCCHHIDYRPLAPRKITSPAQHRAAGVIFGAESSQ